MYQATVYAHARGLHPCSCFLLSLILDRHYEEIQLVALEGRECRKQNLPPALGILRLHNLDRLLCAVKARIDIDSHERAVLLHG